MKQKLKVLISIVSIILTVFSVLFNAYADAGLYNQLLVSESNSKIDSSLLGKSDSTEKLSVYIWCTEINYDTVESIVEQRLGYSEDEVNCLETDEIGSKDIADKVNDYIMTKRVVAKELYQSKLSEIITACSIEDDVIFTSKYAPMILAELTYSEIEYVCTNNNVLEVGLHYIETEDVQEASIQTYSSFPTPNSFYSLVEYQKTDFVNFLSSMNIHSIKTKSGLTGNNVKIGMLEDSAIINYDLELPTFRCHVLGDINGYDGALHANRIATLMCGDDGIANNASLYSCDYTGSSISKCYFYQIERLLDEGVKLINMSMGMFPDDIGTYISSTWTNHIILNHHVSIVGAAGNDGRTTGEVGYPLNAENAIAVGACDNMDSTEKTDDIMRVYSSYSDTTGIIKPDVVAADNVFENEEGNGGTSYSSPVVAGTIALMLECRPSLALHPEVIKAIIMSSCQYKARPYGSDTVEDMDSGLTEKQGAGVFDPVLALSITANGNYGYGILKNSDDSNMVNFFYSPYDATNVNVSMSWLNNADNSLKNERPNLDLMLSINSAEVKSENTSSSTEMLYTNIYLSRNFDSEMDYTIRCYNKDYVFNSSSEEIKYGYAWCHNTEEYKVIEQYEGLYFIKNVATGKYLTYDWENEQLLLNNYVGHYHNDYDQFMAITKNSTGNYSIRDAFTYSDGIIANDTVAEYGANSSDIKILQDEEGYYMFKVGSKYMSSNNGLCFESIEDVTSANKWILEEVVYRQGDLDYSGVINNYDQNYLMSYISGTYTPSNAELFLADMNGDGVLDVDDEYEMYLILN